MKKFLLSFIFVAVTAFSFGQAFELYTPEGELFNQGDTVYMAGSAGDLIAGHMYVKNISASSKNVYAKKSYVYLVPGVIDAFCWAGNCYTTMVSPNAETIESGSTATDFSTEYMPQDIPGVSIIRYTFDAGHGDSTWFFIKYTAWPTSVSTANMSNLVSNPFPVPANENINFVVNDVLSQMVVDIIDITGKTVKSVQVSESGLLQIQISELKNGVYFTEIRTGKQVIKTNRIIVR